jgi:hypothetical protein
MGDKLVGTVGKWHAKSTKGEARQDSFLIKLCRSVTSALIVQAKAKGASTFPAAMLFSSLFSFVTLGWAALNEGQAINRRRWPRLSPTQSLGPLLGGRHAT